MEVDIKQRPSLKRQRSFYGKAPPMKRQRTGSFKKASIQTKLLKPQSHSEVKCIDRAHQTSTLSTTAVFTLLNPIVPGDDIYQRTGRTLNMKSLRVQGYLNNTATTVQSFARVMVVYDKQSNAANPVIGDIIQDMNGTPATDVYSHPNLNNRERFVIIKDCRFSNPSVTNAAGVLTNLGTVNTAQSIVIDWFLPLRGAETTYNATGGATIASIVTGALFLITFSSDPNPNWSFDFTPRLRFVNK